MSLPDHVADKIADHLSAIQKVFKPGAKVFLVVDNGEPRLSLVMGDADPNAVIGLIRTLDDRAKSEAAE